MQVYFDGQKCEANITNSNQFKILVNIHNIKLMNNTEYRYNVDEVNTTIVKTATVQISWDMDI